MRTEEAGQGKEKGGMWKRGGRWKRFKKSFYQEYIFGLVDLNLII